jgi:pilus assembly protein CpaC
MGSQQVLLKVRIAEMNRTGMRTVGCDFLALDPKTGALVGTQLGNSIVNGTGTVAARALTAAGSSAVAPATTAFGVFEGGHFDIFLTALRKNSLLRILAEPNLVAMHGQKANFLAGGQYAYPVPQSSTGGAPIVTIQFQQFGVLLEFVPFILDGDLIRLSVDPEVSSPDFTLGTTISGTTVPGLNQRKAHTVVEMRSGQTLAMAGLLQLQMDGTTNRIPVLGDLPILGPFFSNTTGERIEKELIVLVTPYLIDAMNEGQVPGMTPGDEVKGANDLEFFLLNRIEGRTGRDHRETTSYDDPCGLMRRFLRLEDAHVQGAHGFGE